MHSGFLARSATSERKRKKASAKPLPRLEPWLKFVGMAPLTLPQLVISSREQRSNFITSRGGRGGETNLKPTEYPLACPKCNAVRHAAYNTLYDQSTRALNCKSCKTNTSSTRWRCQHGLFWQLCPEHRTMGFGSRSPRDPPGPGLLCNPSPKKPIPCSGLPLSLRSLRNFQG